MFKLAIVTSISCTLLIDYLKAMFRQMQFIHNVDDQLKDM